MPECWTWALDSAVERRVSPAGLSVLVGTGALASDDALDRAKKMGLQETVHLLELICSLQNKTAPENAKHFIKSLCNQALPYAEMAEWILPAAVKCEMSSSDLQNLIEKGGALDGQCNRETALCFVSEQGDIEIVKLLVDKGAAVNAPTVLGRTPVMCAAKSGSAECLQFLIDRGADIHAKGNES